MKSIYSRESLILRWMKRGRDRERHIHPYTHTHRQRERERERELRNKKNVSLIHYLYLDVVL